MKKPLVSIILPAFNAEKYVAQAIESIINQTYENWELLICDDASTDRTKEIIEFYAKKDQRIFTSHNYTNQKLLKTRNRLLTLTKGEYITFQDADDFSAKNRLDLLVKEFLKDEKVGLVSSQVKITDTHGKVIRISSKPTNYESCLAKMYEQNVLGGSMMMIRRSALKTVGFRFRPYFDGLSNQDYDLAFLISENFKSYNLPYHLYFYRQTYSSTSKIISPDRIIAEELVRHLAKQRKNGYKDDIEKNNFNSLEEFFATKQKTYLAEPSLIYIIYAKIFMYNKLFKKAIISAFQAIKLAPRKINNWRTLLYCIRITIIRSWLRT